MVRVRVGESSSAAYDYVQDERYFAIEHTTAGMQEVEPCREQLPMDVRREAFQDCTAYQCGFFLVMCQPIRGDMGGIPPETRHKPVHGARARHPCRSRSLGVHPPYPRSVLWILVAADQKLFPYLRRLPARPRRPAGRAVALGSGGGGRSGSFSWLLKPSMTSRFIAASIS